MEELLTSPTLWLSLLVLGLLAGIFMVLRRPTMPALGTEAPPAPTDILFAALGRTREALAGAFSGVFAREKVDDSAFDALEEALLRADVGPKTTLKLLEELRKEVPKDAPIATLESGLKKKLEQRLLARPGRIATTTSGPLVILVVGVNGSGKTTTIGKLASRYKKQGKSVLLGAGDTYRAGAIDQLKVWGERAGVDVIAAPEGADPAAVLHDTVSAGVARNIDVIICDTAGRLQAHKALMDELGKIKRVISKLLPGAPHEVLLVLDGTMGQNAMSQARIFQEVASVTGVVLTKLDGTAKGGMVVGISEELGLPVKLVGVGEKVEDLRDFEPQSFVKGLFG